VEAARQVSPIEHARTTNGLMKGSGSVALSLVAVRRCEIRPSIAAEGTQDYVLPNSAVSTDCAGLSMQTQNFILGYFQPALRDCSGLSMQTQDFILGYFRPSLRDSSSLRLDGVSEKLLAGSAPTPSGRIDF
jgi:hypothetical protein